MHERELIKRPFNLISKAYFPANKMNCMQKVKEKQREIQLLIDHSRKIP